MTENYSWAPDIYDVLKDLDVRQVAYVPDAGHARLLKMCEADNAMRCIPLTTEEEGISLCSGAWLGGERAVMLLQSSGVGNCINMLSLIETCRFPFCAFVTMRGQWHEFNPWQMPMGTTTKQALQTAGCLVDEVEDPSDVGAKAAATIHKAFVGQQSSVLLLSQRMVPIKTFGK